MAAAAPAAPASACRSTPVYQKQRVATLDRFLLDARSRFEGKPILREDFVYELMNRAGTPRGYALIADQTPLATTRSTGRASSTATRRSSWARRRSRGFSIRRSSTSRCAALAADAIRCGSLPLADAALRRGSRGRDDTPIMERFARQLEIAIQESPADWLWLQKRWKYPKPEQPETEGRRRRAKP